MTNTFRLTTLALTALLIAGCGTTTQSSPGPSADAAGSASAPSAAASAVATTGIAPSPLPSLAPTLATSCTDLPAAYEVPRANVNSEIGHISTEFGPELVVSREYPDRTFTFDPAPAPEVGLLPAGYAVPVNLWIVYQFDAIASIGPISLTSVTAEIRIHGIGRKVLPVEWAKDGPTDWGLIIRGVPDVDAAASVDLGIEWRDRCFTYSAMTSLRDVQLVSTTTTAGCSMKKKSYFDDLTAALAAPVAVGSGEARLVSPVNEAKYLPLISAGIDAHPAYAWDREGATVTAQPGEILVVSRDQPGFELLGMTSTVWTRRSVAEATTDWPPQAPLEVVVQATPAREPDGSFRLRVPDEPGRYVAALTFGFDWTCATGQAWAVFSLDVAT
jgi:hypothetical protein